MNNNFGGYVPESIPEIRARVAGAQKNYLANIHSIDYLLRKERGYVSKLEENMPVIFTFSGGLDSSVAFGKVIDDFGVKVFPLFLRRGARSEKLEEAAFDFFVDFYSQRFPDKVMTPEKLIFEIPPKNLKKTFPKNLALTQGHPLRNSTINNLAVMYAVSLQGRGYNVKTVLTGSVGDDSTEPELGLLSLRAQTLSSCVQLGDWQWNITSPLIDPYLVTNGKIIYKKDLIEYALQKFIPLERTRSCFSSEELADGTCNACKKRLEAFRLLGVSDPALYKNYKIDSISGGGLRV